MNRLPLLARRLALPVLGVILLLLVLTTVSLSTVWRTLSQLQPYEVLILALVNGLLVLAMTARWWLLLLALGHAIPYLRVTGYRLTAFGISYFTPGPHVGGEPYQVYVVAKRHGVPYADAIAAVSLDKLLELLINFAFLAAAAIFVLPKVILHEQPGGPYGAAALAIASIPAVILAALWRGKHPVSSILFASLALWRSLTGKTQPEEPAQTPRWLRTIRRSEEQASLVCRTRPAFVLAAIVASVVAWIGMIGEYWLMTSMLDLNLSPTETIAALFAARLAILLPFPAALGALEASQALAMSAIGILPGAGVGLSIVIRSRDVLIGLLGLSLGGAGVWRDYQSTQMPQADDEDSAPQNSTPRFLNP
jgi:glycosyltransferase 2 family protein